ncbi:MAG: aldehyde dehydrogenase family protein [Acidobacteria bacterium]|nr:MAG: aldehyde dehydrogenase family protein [Acidobacteriota bacterium]
MARLYPFVIGGELVSPEHKVVVHSPFDGDPVGECGDATGLEVERAVEAAAAARAPMAALAGWQRSQALSELENAVRTHQDEFADLMAAEAGKPISAASVEVKRALVTLRTAAEEAKRIGGTVEPLDVAPGAEDRWAIARRFPIGIIAGITPFNFPLNLVLHKLAPAIASGNPIILKASPRAPLCALRLGEMALGLNLPAGAVNVLSGGAEPAVQLCEHDRIAMVSFTGSAAVGWNLKARAARKKVVLELGGNAANIVHSDADLALAAERLVAGAFSYAGQSCISVQRVLVHRAVYKDLRCRLLDRILQLRVGDPRDAATDVGPMINAEAATRAFTWMQEAVAAGAQAACGMKRDGGFVWPTILENVPEQTSIWKEEAFAPVLLLRPYDSFDEALREANASRYGLQAGVFTRDLNLAWRAFEHLEVGAVALNEVSSWRMDPMPYGGVKDSGSGREGLRSSIEEMTELRVLLLHAR